MVTKINKKVSELKVITAPKKMFEYIMIITEKSLTMFRKEMENTFLTYKHTLENNDAFIEVDNLIFVKNNETELNKLLTGEYKYIDYFKEVILIYLKKIQPGNIVDYI